MSFRGCSLQGESYPKPKMLISDIWYSSSLFAQIAHVVNFDVLYAAQNPLCNEQSQIRTIAIACTTVPASDISPTVEPTIVCSCFFVGFLHLLILMLCQGTHSSTPMMAPVHAREIERSAHTTSHSSSYNDDNHEIINDAHMQQSSTSAVPSSSAGVMDLAGPSESTPPPDTPSPTANTNPTIQLRWRNVQVGSV